MAEMVFIGMNAIALHSFVRSFSQTTTIIHNNRKLIHLWSMCAVQYLLDFTRLAAQVPFSQTWTGAATNEKINEEKKREKRKKERT